MHTFLILSSADHTPWVVYQPVTAGYSRQPHHQQAAANGNRQQHQQQTAATHTTDGNRQRQRALGVAPPYGRSGQRQLALFS